MLRSKLKKGLVLNSIARKSKNRAHFSDMVEMSTRSPMLQSKLKIGSKSLGNVPPPKRQDGWLSFQSYSSGFNSDG